MNLKGIRLYTHQYANRQLSWFGEDNPELFEKNQKDPDQCRLLKDNGWLDNTIDYKFNSYGFRGGEFKGDISNFCVFGDSVTFGSAMKEENLYPSLIANHTGLYCNNFGVPGGSNDSSVRLAITWLEELRPKFVIWQTTFKHRLEWIESENHATIYGVQAVGGGNPPTSNDKFFLHWISIEANRSMAFTKNLMTMKWLCKTLECPLIITDIEEFFSPENDRGRDLLHPGPTRHREMANKFLKDLREMSLI